MENHPLSWQSGWLRMRATALKDSGLDDWAAYYDRLQKQSERRHLCATAS